MSKCARYQNYRLCPDALGDHRGEVNIYFPELDPAQASLRVQAEGSWAMSGRPPESGRIPDYVGRLHADLDAVDFLKCDVEGAELLVLQGARQTLLGWTPKIFLELNPDWSRSFGYEPEDTHNDPRLAVKRKSSPQSVPRCEILRLRADEASNLLGSFSAIVVVLSTDRSFHFAWGATG